MRNSLILLLIITIILPLRTIANKNDSVRPVLKPIHKNIIKINPTPMMLWNTRNITLGYERVINPKQSFAFQAGFLVLPQLFEDTIKDLIYITSREKIGINLCAEYRFYLTKNNARPTPAGVYIGPFASYYGYKFKNGIDIFNSNLLENGFITGKYNVVNVGFELGYQFILWKRFTIDLVMIGPALSYYWGTTEFTGNLNLEQLAILNGSIYDKLNEKFALDELLTLNKSFKSSGRLQTFGVGYRYLIQFGFHF